MFHPATNDAAGNMLRSAEYHLLPGRSAFVQLTFPGGENPRLAINSCVLPAPGGRAVPAVEVFDRATGEVTLLIGPAVARMSQSSGAD